MKTIMTTSPTSQTITSGWGWARLRNVNYFIENYAKAQVSDAVKNHYVGLARYYRAMFYFSMVKRYSDVPWYSNTLGSEDENLYKPRDPRALVMDSVMADLGFAANYVRETVPVGTPGKWAVKTFQARVALYEGTYRRYHAELNLQSTAQAFLETAASVTTEIINSGKYRVYSTGNETQDYFTLFNSQDLLNNSEVILTNIFDLNRNRSQNVNFTVFGDYEQAPARDLVQTYLMKDGSRFTDQPGYQTFGFAEEFINRDPCLSQTLAYPGWTRVPDTRPYVQRLNRNFTGYHQLKGYVNSTDNNILNGVDFPVYRYAEVLLTFAEAKAELNQLTQADLDMSVNLLRRRAGIPDLNLAAANADPDPVLEQKYPNVSAAGKGALLEIRRERRVEFAFESFRFDDLMRWQAGQLLTRIPEGMYFPGLGKFDLTGDGVEDIKLIGAGEVIPGDDNKDRNSLGEMLIYYRAGAIGEDVTVTLRNGTGGGTMVTETTQRTFTEPKYYYRPIPYAQTVMNPQLTQIFGWD